MGYLITGIVCFFVGFLLSQLIDNELIVIAKRRAEETAKKYAARDYYARNMCRIENGERVDSIPEHYKW
jgi:hypothetical protein